jgi:hypothetical protein
MTCTTYDKLYLDGMAQPILGTFTLKIGGILFKTRLDDMTNIALFTRFKELLDNTINLKKGEKSD